MSDEAPVRKSTTIAPAATNDPPVAGDVVDLEAREPVPPTVNDDELAAAMSALASPAKQLRARRSKQSPALSENLRDRRQIRAERQELSEQRLAIEMERIELDHAHSELDQQRRRLERAAERLAEDRKQLIADRDQLRSERLALVELRKRLPDTSLPTADVTAAPHTRPLTAAPREARPTGRRWRRK